MTESETLRVQLDYPMAHVKEPILYHLITDYRLVPNIRRARIDAHTGGTLALDLTGKRADLEAGLAFLRGLSIQVTELGSEANHAV